MKQSAVKWVCLYLNYLASWVESILHTKFTSLEGRVRGLGGWTLKEVGHSHCLGNRGPGLKGDQFLKTLSKAF